MSSQGVSVDVVLWLLRDAQAKYNHEVNAKYQTQLNDIEKELRECITNTYLPADQLRAVVSKIMAAKEFDPPTPKVEWNLINSTLAGLLVGMVRLADLPLDIQRQIKQSAFKSQPGIHRSPQLSESATTSDEVEDKPANPSAHDSADDEEWFDTSAIGIELAHRLENITLPTQVDNSLGDGSDNAAVNDSTLPTSSEEGLDTPEFRSATPDTSYRHKKNGLSRKMSIDSDEMTDQSESTDSNKENRLPQDDLPSMNPRYMGGPAGGVPRRPTCFACGALEPPTVNRGYGAGGFAMSVQASDDDDENQHDNPRATTGHIGQMNINEEREAMEESDGYDVLSFRPKESKRAEYRKPVRRTGRIGATSAGSPIQKSRTSENEGLGFDDFGDGGIGDNGDIDMTAAPSMLGAVHEAAVMVGAGHAAPIPDLSGGDSVPTGPSDAPYKKRKRTDSTSGSK